MDSSSLPSSLCVMWNVSKGAFRVCCAVTMEEEAMSFAFSTMYTVSAFRSYSLPRWPRPFFRLLSVLCNIAMMWESVFSASSMSRLSI